MSSKSEQVAEFHRLIGAPVGIPIQAERGDAHVAMLLSTYSSVCKGLSMNLLHEWKRKPAQHRLLRAHLLLEEPAECLVALANCKEVDLLDGLCDMEYVTIGTGVCYGLPMEAGFDEVHRSNMTKTPPEGDIRASSKGRMWQPPNLREIIDRSRHESK